MNEKALLDLLQAVKAGDTEVDEAVRRLRDLPFEDIGYAMVDHHRALRRGFPETIFSQGKSLDQIRGIAQRMVEQSERIMATRASEEVYQALKDVAETVTYYDLARIVVLGKPPESKTRGSVLIVSAGTADLPVAEEAAVSCEMMGNTTDRLYDVGVAGIHRILAHRSKLDESRVLVIVAGMDGALPSVVAGLTNRPVIAVPTSVGYGASFGGLAALLTMLNSCATGVSVVNIDNGYGAAYCASLINRQAEGGD